MNRGESFKENNFLDNFKEKIFSKSFLKKTPIFFYEQQILKFLLKKSQLIFSSEKNKFINNTRYFNDKNIRTLIVYKLLTMKYFVLKKNLKNLKFKSKKFKFFF